MIGRMKCKIELVTREINKKKDKNRIRREIKTEEDRGRKELNQEKQNEAKKITETWPTLDLKFEKLNL